MTAKGAISAYGVPNSIPGATLAPIDQYFKFEFENDELEDENGDNAVADSQLVQRRNDEQLTLEDSPMCNVHGNR